MYERRVEKDNDRREKEGGEERIEKTKDSKKKKKYAYGYEYSTHKNIWC